MSFFNGYPYTDFHELNLDMILAYMKKLHADWTEFQAVNKITNAGAWDITKQYKAWTVVSDNNAGYISLKPVPVGIPLTDSNYWGIIADYNILITDLTSRVAALETLTASLNTRVTKHSYRFNKKVNKHVVIVGDSYSDDSTDAAKLIRASGIFNVLDVVAAGGRGFTGKDGAQGGTTGPELEWLTWFRDWCDGNSDDYLADIDDVYIFGGFNDVYSTYTTIRSHMNDFFTYFNTRLPMAQFHLCMYAWADKSASITTPNETHSGAYFRNRLCNNVYKAYSTCGEWGCEFLGAILNPLHDYQKSFDATHYHPSIAASEEAATEMLALMIGSHSTYGGDKKEFSYLNFDGTDQILGVVSKFKDHYHIESRDSRFLATTGAATSGAYGDTILVTSAPSDPDNSDYIAGMNNSHVSMIPVIYIYNSVAYSSFIFFDEDERLHLRTVSTIPASSTIWLYIGSCDIPLLCC